MASEDRRAFGARDDAVEALDGVSPYAEHPQDVLQQWLAWREHSATALAVVVTTQGGGVRSPGALMAVRADGAFTGYVSGGCIDADVVLHAKVALASGAPKRLRYGAGSSFADIRLPCGGAIEVAILPDMDPRAIAQCHARLADRTPARLNFHEIAFEAFYAPKLRLRIAGQGADAMALVRLARAAGLEVVLQSPHAGVFESALRNASGLAAQADDSWTAFVAMIHDPDWEDLFLRQALQGSAFYVGAVGSKATHARRCERLRASGVSKTDVARIYGPIGLIPSLREASMIAVSALSEIVAAYHRHALAPFRRTAVILLAAGASSRFQGGDKLLAPYRLGCVLDGAAGHLAHEEVGARIAVVSADATKRHTLLRDAGWQIVINSEAHTGLASSLACGLRAAMAHAPIDAGLVLLADMPNVPDMHLRALQRALTAGRIAVMSQSQGAMSPPAIFSREAFDTLLQLEGDVGARAAFARLGKTATIELDGQCAFDIDTRADLAAADLKQAKG
jgi:xanthine/CO dehydrogenase XdhC/CoxF family maturation factor/CTP:molybdopterin cytidylyltransferase MocA